MSDRERVLAELVEYAAYAGAYASMPPAQRAEVMRLVDAVKAESKAESRENTNGVV
jgi:hypothetical protein